MNYPKHFALYPIWLPAPEPVSTTPLVASDIAWTCVHPLHRVATTFYTARLRGCGRFNQQHIGSGDRLVVLQTVS